MTLDEILNSVSVPLEHDGLAFRLVPMSSARITEWNRVLLREPAEGVGPLDHAAKQRDDQMNLMAAHMRSCLTDGKPQRVTGKWLSETIPQTVLQELAEYFVEGKRPAWAGEPGN